MKTVHAPLRNPRPELRKHESVPRVSRSARVRTRYRAKAGAAAQGRSASHLKPHWRSRCAKVTCACFRQTSASATRLRTTQLLHSLRRFPEARPGDMWCRRCHGSKLLAQAGAPQSSPSDFRSMASTDARTLASRPPVDSWAAVSALTRAEKAAVRRDAPEHAESARVVGCPSPARANPRAQQPRRRPLPDLT